MERGYHGGLGRVFKQRQRLRRGPFGGRRKPSDLRALVLASVSRSRRSVNSVYRSALADFGPGALHVSDHRNTPRPFKGAVVGIPGLTSPAKLERCKPELRGWRSWFNPRQTPCAVCIPPGAQLLLLDIPRRLQQQLGLGPLEHVTFIQTHATEGRHRDGLRFRNNQEILLAASCRRTTRSRAFPRLRRGPGACRRAPRRRGDSIARTASGTPYLGSLTYHF